MWFVKSRRLSSPSENLGSSASPLSTEVFLRTQHYRHISVFHLVEIKKSRIDFCLCKVGAGTKERRRKKVKFHGKPQRRGRGPEGGWGRRWVGLEHEEMRSSSPRIPVANRTQMWFGVMFCCFVFQSGIQDHHKSLKQTHVKICQIRDHQKVPATEDSTATLVKEWTLMIS